MSPSIVDAVDPLRVLFKEFLNAVVEDRSVYDSKLSNNFNKLVALLPSCHSVFQGRIDRSSSRTGIGFCEENIQLDPQRAGENDLSTADP